MAQYSEGQRLQGSDGNIYVVRNGVPVAEGAMGPAIGGNPLIGPQTIKATNEAAASQYAPRTAAAEATIKVNEAANAQAVAVAERDRAIAEARKSEVELEKLKVEQTKVDPKSGAYKSLQDQIDRVTEVYRQQLQGGLPNWINDVIPDAFQPRVDAFDAAAQGLSNPFMAAFRIPGVGSQSDTELKQFLAANTPAQGDSDAVIEEKIRNVQTRLNAEQPNKSTPLVGGNQQGATGIATGGTRDVVDPALKATGDKVGRMISNGVPDGKILKFLRDSGVDPASTNINQALKERKTPGFRQWQRANPGAAYPIGEDFYTKQVPMSGARQLFNRTAATDAGGAVAAGLASSANAISGGRLDDAVGALSGDPAMAQTGMQLLRTNHPAASFVGDMAGQASTEALLSLVPGARAMMATRWGRRGADAGYGAYSGSGENGLEGAVTGAASNAGFGSAFRGLQRGAGSAFTGVRNANLGYLNDAGIPLTVGQIGRGSDNVVGHALGGIEERMAGLPISDAIISNARRRGDEAFNLAAFREVAPGVNDTGAMGLAQARGAQNAAYGAVRAGAVPVDPAFNTLLSATQKAGTGLHRHSADIADVVNDVRAQIASGAMSGEQYQAAMQAIRQARATLKTDVMGHKADTLLKGVEDDLVDLGNRAGGSVPRDLANANAITGRLKIIEGAEKKLPSQRSGELFSPSTLNQSAISNTEKFGGIGKALSPDRPFYNLTTAGMDVMPNLTPDSGTAGRAILYSMLLGGGVGGGIGFGQSEEGQGGQGSADGAVKGGALALALAAPYSKTGQKAIQKALLGKRSPRAEQIGDFLINHPRFAGMFGSALGRDIFLHPELP